MVFSGCINSPSSNDDQSTIDIENNEELPENIKDGNDTHLDDLNINNKESVEEQDEKNITTIEDLDNVIIANNQFNFNIYSKLIKNNDENIFYSPYSISSAFAITYEGARGKTAKEIQSVFRFPLNNDTRRNEFLEIYNELNKDNKKYQLNTANALWAAKNYKFLEEYFNVIKKYYGGNVTNLDFINDPEGSRKIINDWVEDQTNDKIKDLIPQGVIDALTRLVITNAIYFKGKWKKQFDEKYTSERDFNIDSNKSVKVPMMYLKDKFNYTKTEELQIIELPYKGNDISMLIFLPNENNISIIDKAINVQNLTTWKENLTESKVKLYLPKFTFETKYSLIETLNKMGMITAFSGGADFSGMDGSKNLFIKSVIHQAFINVNEEGTEAAAATSVTSATCIDMTPVFRADHPFIFLIQERESGNILFMGRAMDPTK